MKYRRLSQFVIIGLFITVWLTPSVFAVVEEPPAEPEPELQAIVNLAPAPTTAGACSLINTLTITEDLKPFTEELKKLQIERQEEIEKVRQKRNLRRIEVREQIKEFYEKFLEMYEKQAKEDRQKKGVEEFKKDFQRITDERFNDMETINHDYRNELDLIIIKKNEEVNDAIKQFELNVNELLDKARFECYRGLPESKIKENLLQRIKVAKDTYGGALSMVNTYRLEIQILNRRLRERLNEANEFFNDDLDKLTEELKQSF